LTLVLLAPLSAQAGPLVTRTLTFNAFPDGFLFLVAGPAQSLGSGYQYVPIGFGQEQEARDIGDGEIVVAERYPGDVFGSGQILSREDGRNFEVLSFDIADLTDNPNGGGGTGGLVGSGYRVGFSGSGGDTEFSPTSSTFVTVDVSANPIFQGLSGLGINLVSGPDDDFAIDNIVVRAEQDVWFDVKPESCPNPIDTKSRGVVPVAILGTAEFDVTQVDPSTVALEGVAPLRWDYEDVATPFNGPSLDDAFDCTEEGPDGFVDLTLKFDNQELVAALGPVEDGDVLVLEVYGHLGEEFGGDPFYGYDLVLIKKKGK
jgi:hypothetical protein